MDLDENVSITPPPPGNPVSISPAITATPTLLQVRYFLCCFTFSTF